MMDATEQAVEAVTGMKNQLMNKGWSEPAAEQLVVGIMFQNAQGNAN
jgi:hypothetical protein